MQHTHPAQRFTFDHLLTNLMERVNSGLINVSRSGDLALFNYSKECQFEHNWDIFTMMARGLILDLKDECLVALTFPKFFNASEKEGASVVKFDSPFDAYAKMDGSLGIVYYHNSVWHVATRGSFASDQSVWAENWLHQNINVSLLDKNVTYLCEIIYAENRIVINYSFEGLVMLGAYHLDNDCELDYDHDLVPMCAKLGMRIAERHSFGSFVEAQEFVKTLPGNEEGFVIRFRDSGERVKLKGNEYCSLHKMISNITALAIWELLCAGYSLEDYKKAMPEEFWAEIDELAGHFIQKLDLVMHEVEELHVATVSLSDKDLGISLSGGTLRGSPHGGIDRKSVV